MHDIGKVGASAAPAPVTVLIPPPPPRRRALERRLTIRMPESQVQRLEALATASGTDRSGAARHLLAEALERVAAAA